MTRITFRTACREIQSILAICRSFIPWPFNCRMVIRWFLLSMGWILLFYAPGESAEFVQGVVDAMASLVNGYAIHQAGGLPPASTGATGNRRNHVEIPQQHVGRRFCF